MLVEGNLTEDICDQGIDLGGEETPADPAEALHQWADDEQLQKAKRLLRPLPTRKNQVASSTTAEASPRLRFDPPSSDSLKVPLPKAETPPQVARPKPVPRANAPAFASPALVAPSPRLLSGMGWGVVSLGLMGMVCGGVLLIWSLATGRVELWNLGLPIGLVGQGGLLIGMLCTILSRRTTQAGSTQRTDFAAVSAGSPHSRAFPVGYSASHPQTPAILAELRGQLDTLSAQMAAQEPASARPWF